MRCTNLKTEHRVLRRHAVPPSVPRARRSRGRCREIEASAAARRSDEKGDGCSSSRLNIAPASRPPGRREVTYSYHSDGHRKATLEDVFRDTDEVKAGNAPWNMGWQTNERNIMWNKDLSLRLLKSGMTHAELEEALATLVRLLPDIAPRLPSLRPDLLCHLTEDTNAVATKLLELKALFPHADCGRMLVRELTLIAEPWESLARRAAALRDFLPDADIDVIVQENPCVLSVDSFKAAVEDARRLVPGLNVEEKLATDPEFILSLQKGSDMIPYDALPDNPWGHR